MLGTSDAWSTSHLSQQRSKPAYYIVDCRISDSIQNLNFRLHIQTLVKLCPLIKNGFSLWSYLLHAFFHQLKWNGRTSLFDYIQDLTFRLRIQTHVKLRNDQKLELNLWSLNKNCAGSWQKLGTILENILLQKLELQKNVSN